MTKVKSFIHKYKIEIIIFIFAFAFSWWLMFSTFSYKDGAMLISQKAWSDFASHIPLIRSFSFGNNFPPQYPLFSGPPIKYHFLFYAFVGILERIGLRIDFALNIPSALGFTFLILMIYIFAKEIFKSKAVGLLSIFLFLFNGSLSFIYYFLKHPLSSQSFLQIFSNTTFPSFGPYDNNIVSAFWNLNIYTNQRHLAISYALSLFLIYLFLKLNISQKDRNLKISMLIGITLGFSFILNMAVFLMTILVLLCMLIFLKNKRHYIVIALIFAGIIALPQYLYIQLAASTFKLSIHLGYLVNKLNSLTFLNYWIQNLGFNFILIPLGFFFANKFAKKILIAFFSLFIIGNLIQFSPEIAANHKFFNYFMIVGVMFTAFVLVKAWRKKIFLRPVVIISIFFLILSGIIDFFPILNDGKIYLSDYPINKDISWIMKNTNPNSVFLNTQYLYNNASVAGRKIFLGWPYFAWSQGYDTTKRDEEIKNFFSLKDLFQICHFLQINNISYVYLNNNSNDYKYDKSFWNKFNKVYVNVKTNSQIIKTNDICR